MLYSTLRAIALLALAAVPVLRADVTLRYKTDFKFGSFMPPGAMESAMKAAKAPIPLNIEIRMKGDKGYMNFGEFVGITDFVKQEITLVSAEKRQFATMPVKDYADKMAAAMPQMSEMPAEARKIMESIKASTESRQTGRTEMIRGIQAEEREVTMNFEVAVPGIPQSGPMMKLVMHMWTAKPEEVLRVPALRELTAYSLWSSLFMDQRAMMGKIVGTMPGMGQAISNLVEDLGKTKAVTLRSTGEVFVPFMAALAQQAAKAGKTPPVQFDPASPLMTFTQEAMELSSAPVDESLFRIPDGYQAVDAAEIIKALVPQRPAAPKQ